MTDESHDGQSPKMNDETRELIDRVSAALLRMHKVLLDDAKKSYETANGPIAGVNAYFQLVIDHEHFAWLRKLSSLVALMDEATTLRRLASEAEAQGLLDEAAVILNFKDADEGFNKKFAAALKENPDAAAMHRETLAVLA